MEARKLKSENIGSTASTLTLRVIINHLIYHFNVVGSSLSWSLDNLALCQSKINIIFDENKEEEKYLQIILQYIS